MFALLGPIISGILGIIDKVVPDTAEATRIKGEIQALALADDLEELKSAASIIQAEASGNWLQRSWRPILMLVVVAIVANNYLLAPYLSLFTDKVTVLALPDKLWTLMIVGVGGYIAGRSGEKMVKTWKNPDA